MADSSISLGLPLAPVGTIVCFAGDASNSSIISDLHEAGWLPCDGSKLMVSKYPELFASIGHAFGGEQDQKGQFIRFYVPSFNDVGEKTKFGCLYVRGVNGTAKDVNTGFDVDPDASSRVELQQYGNVGNDVGSIQKWATTAPNTPFTTDAQAHHKHSVPHIQGGDHHAYYGSTFSVSRFNSGETETGRGGAHSHEVTSGGDPETRPVSMALWYLIKFKGE